MGARVLRYDSRIPASYHISVEPYPYVIIPFNPAALSMELVADIEDDILREEVEAKLARWRASHPSLFRKRDTLGRARE